MSQTEAFASLEAPPSLTADAYDRCVREVEGLGRTDVDLVIDLSDAKFIEVAALTSVLSTLINRHRNQLGTIFRLPRSKRVRDFMRSWSFAEAVRDATDRSFFSFVHPDDRQYFGENPTVEDQQYAGIVLFGGTQFERILSKRFFGFTVFRPTADRFRAKLAVDVASRWKRKVITSVLDHVLFQSGEMFASRIIYEAVLNSVRHPDASTIVLASHCDGKSKKNTITLCVWDDGRTIAQTLRSALDSEIPISTGEEDDSFNLRYLVRQGDEKRVYRSSFVPTNDQGDGILLFSSLLPGISSAPFPAKTSSVVSPDPQVSKSLELSKPGMGLFLLLNAAVDMYGGSVAIRSGTFFLNAKKCDDEMIADYSVKIVGGMPTFPGNLLTVRLPRKEAP